MEHNLLASKRLSNLDVYKCVCIIFVIVTHYQWKDSERVKYLFPFWIDMAVPIFMVITGYVSALSFDKKNHNNIVNAYRPIELIKRWLRFLTPYCLVYVTEIVIHFLLHNDISVRGAIGLFILGGIGPGSYYTPVMMQIVAMIPAIWNIIQRCHFKGLCICFGVNVIYEILKTVIHMSPGLYRLLGFRYLFVLSFGCFLYLRRDEKNNKLPYVMAGIIGAIYIFVFNYTYATPVITNQWTHTSVFAVLYIVPILCFLIKFNVHNKRLELIGQASYNIFLVQMFFYSEIAGVIYQAISSHILQIVINIIICCGLGIVFYKVEAPLTKNLVNRIDISQK